MVGKTKIVFLSLLQTEFSLKNCFPTQRQQKEINLAARDKICYYDGNMMCRAFHVGFCKEFHMSYLLEKGNMFMDMHAKAKIEEDKQSAHGKW